MRKNNVYGGHASKPAVSSLPKHQTTTRSALSLNCCRIIKYVKK